MRWWVPVGGAVVLVLSSYAVGAAFGQIAFGVWVVVAVVALLCVIDWQASR